MRSLWGEKTKMNEIERDGRGNQQTERDRYIETLGKWDTFAAA